VYISAQVSRLDIVALATVKGHIAYWAGQVPAPRIGVSVNFGHAEHIGDADLPMSSWRAEMPIPKVVGRWNKVGLNRLTRHIAPTMPGLGLVVHRGRRSGRRYETPVNVFTVGDRYVIALTYGPDTDWVKNVLAAGGCELITRGQAIQLRAPELFRDESRSRIRPVERQVLRALRVADFLSLAPATSTTS
jgi:deazaflavin-dependent oxidoreductase (nitroreductase family)